MTGSTPKIEIGRQIPFHIKESNPLFTKFLEYYYEFQENSKISAIIQEIKQYNDIDSAEESFLLNFFEEFRKIPHSIVADKRLIAKRVYDLYKSKGSADSLKLLFRIVYGQEISVNYPNENILRSSDGRWIQNSIITATQLEGALTPSSNRIQITNTRGSFEFELKNVEELNTNETRFIFEPRKSYFVDNEQIIRVYTNETLDYVGQAISMPSYVEIETPGAFWQVGQVIRLPGTIKDTICQVRRVGSDGSIKKLDIVDYGIGYASDEGFLVSPFKYKPSSSYLEHYVEKVAEGPDVYEHSMNIFDITDGFIENIVGYDSNQAYVLTGYMISEYLQRLAFTDTVSNETNTSSAINDEITIDDWVKSRTRLRLRNRYFAHEAGFYLDQRGQPSAPNIRLQDSFFYQIFSYVIGINKRLSEYESVLKMVHPAGTKYFTNYEREVSVSSSATVSRILSRESILLLSRFGVGEETLTVNAGININDLVEATNDNVNDNYDGNNNPELFDTNNPDNYDTIVVGIVGDPTSVYDANDYDMAYGLEMDADPSFDSGNYDLAQYAEDALMYIEQYTAEEDSIDITLN